MTDSSDKISPDEPKAKEKKSGKFGWLTWEHTLDITKVLLTFYAACIGTFVTMQFNERQHELARMEAIAKMLPHLAQYEEEPDDSSDSTDKSGQKNSQTALQEKANKPQKASAHLARDGAMWAIFRTANNKTMLRDLASLFPEDIYRVVSSIAASGALNNDPEAVTALQVSSEKLASKYSNTSHTELASRLYSQALHLKENKATVQGPISIIDLNDLESELVPNEEHMDDMLKSMNKLADMHRKESESSTAPSTGRWTAKQMYKRVRSLGNKTPSNKAKLEVAQADLALANLYLKEHKRQTAVFYLKEALQLNRAVPEADSQIIDQIKTQLQALENPAPPTNTKIN